MLYAKNVPMFITISNKKPRTFIRGFCLIRTFPNHNRTGVFLLVLEANLLC